MWKARACSSSCSQWRRLTIVLSSLRQQWCVDAVGCVGTVHIATVCSGVRSGCSGCIMVVSMLALWQRRWWQQLRHSALVVAADAVGCMGSVHRATVCSGVRSGCSGCIMVLSMLVLWQRRWRQQLRHSALVVAAPSCSKCSGNVVAASAGRRLALAAARARSGDASRSRSAACDSNGVSMLWAAWAVCTERQCALVCDLDAVDASWWSACSRCGSGAGGSS